jgi:hypothetical protein
MMFYRRGLSLVAVAFVVVGLVGCSSGSESGQLRFVPSGAMGNEAAADAKMMWADVSYEVEGTLPEMPSEMISYEIGKQSAPITEFENIARAFGVEGEARKDPASAGDFEETFEAYAIGDSDMSDDEYGEAMWMYGDGRLWSWSYYPGDVGAPSDSTISSDGGSTSSGSSSGSEPCPPDDPECIERNQEIPEPPAPPQNIPSQSEVETLTQELLAELDVDAADVQIWAYSDEWSAWSQVNLMLGDIASPIAWYFSFGEDAELMSASGMILDVKESDTYKLADATESVSRLGDYRYYGGYGVAAARDASIGWSSVSSTDIAEVEPVAPIEDIDDSGDDSVTVIDEVPSTDAPITPEKITVTVTSVKMSYAWMFEENGTQVLMPAFAYSSKDGEVGTVLALSDDLFDFEEITDTTIDGEDPMPEPEPGVEDPTSPISDEDAGALIGLTEDEAMKVADSQGWEFRVAARDGEQYMLTTDYVMNRVNVTIVEGAVTEVTVG